MGEVIDFKKSLAAEVIPLFAGAPAQAPAMDANARAAIDLARDADRRQTYLARAARAAREALGAGAASSQASLCDEVLDLCHVLELSAETARDLGQRAMRPAGFALIAQDIEAVSERLVYLLAQIEGDRA